MPHIKIEKEFKEVVWKEGFTLEHDVFVVLEKDGWELSPNRYFLESKEGPVQEYDLLASKKFTYKNLIFFIVLVVECKYNSHRIVFYVRKLKNKSYPLIYSLGQTFSEYFTFDNIAQTMDSIKQYKKIFFSKEQVFGYQSFKQKKKEKNDKKNKKGKQHKTQYTFSPDNEFTERVLFKAIKSVSSAVKYEKSKCEEKDNRMYIFFPLVISTGKLYKAFLTGKRKTMIEETHFRYKTGKVSLARVVPDEYYIHIINVKILKKIIRFLNQIFNKYKENIKKSVDKKK